MHILDEFPEEKQRMEKFAEIVKKLKEINNLAFELSEYPEFNTLIMSLRDMEDNYRLRMNSISKTYNLPRLIWLDQLLTTLDQ